MTDYGKESVCIVELDVPRCQLEYGTTNAAGTCAAQLGPEGETQGSPPIANTGTRKCYNTRVTCQDPDNYLPETQVIRFSHPQRGLTRHYDNVLPCLVPGADNPRVTPGAINLGGMDRSMSALGVREAVDIEASDFRWNDHLFDKYRLERISGAAQADGVGYDPAERGSFWPKFLARNPYYAAFRARVKFGFMGDALADMRTCSYIVDRITGPKNGVVRIALKDLFSLIEARKAVAPIASQGELDAGIDASVTAATLSPAGIGDAEYPASGYIAVGSEVMSFTRSGDALTIVRGALDTEADEHDAEDLVQLVYNVEAELAHDIIYELLTEYAEIPAANIDKAEWDILAASMTELYTGRVTEPTPVRELIGEIAEQAGCTVWHDPATDEIRFQPLRPTTANTTVNDRDWIIDGSLDVERQDAKRVSRCLVYAGQINPTLDLDDAKNFRFRVITPDLDAESVTQYGVPSIKTIYSRWIPQFARASATAVGDRIIALFRDPPLEASFRVYRDREGQLDLAQPFLLQSFETQDDTGAETAVLMAPVEIERGENEIGVRAQGMKFFTAPADAADEREIFLDSPDMRNLNLRTIHDTIYAAPVGDEVVTAILPEGFTIGSTSTASAALRTGDWP